MIILCHTDHFSLFFSRVTSVFYNILRVSYWIDMMTSVLTLSWHLIYSMVNEDSVCLRHHSTFGWYYYFLGVRPYLISEVTDMFALTSYPPISDILVPRVLSPMTISTYMFSFPYLFLFLLFLTRPRPNFQHVPWFRAVPCALYLFASTPLLYHINSWIDIIANILLRNSQACILCCSMKLKCYCCQPGS